MKHLHMNEWDVLQGIARFVVENGRSPTIRELKIELGYGGTGKLWRKLDNLAKVGVIEWPTGDHSYKNRRRLALAQRFGVELKENQNRRESGGIILKVPLVKPVQIPIINIDVPGSKCVEIRGDGRIFVGDKEMAIVPILEKGDDNG